MINFELDGLEEIAEGLTKNSIKASTRSALGSAGFFMRKEVFKQIDSQGSYAGAKWKGLHSITKLRNRSQFGRQMSRTLNQRKKPLAKLKKFVRYRNDEKSMQVLLTSRKGGKPGPIDRNLRPFAVRLEKGERRVLSNKSRRWRAALGFPVSKETRYVSMFPRPVFSPVLRKSQQEMIAVFERKFTESIERKRNA